MHRKVRWITETAAMLALLICLQWLGSFVPEQLTKQLITGTLVNCVLAVTVLAVGMRGGIVVAVASPICAFLLNIAPNFVTVLPIMLGNVSYVVLLRLMLRKDSKTAWKKPVAVTTAAAVKFGVLYVLVVEVICGLAAEWLLGKKVGDVVVLAPKMLKMLPVMFTWPQLITAIVGGLLAMLILPVLRKALHR